ncbi:MAG: replication protein [Paludibacteraceae bacterium]|nr:replication protein [Paludibacteraceae bacterium]
MAEKKSTDNRTRNWSFVLYEDSAPENWREVLDDMHIEWIESPWHDKDVNANGEPKKKHKHILLLFQGKKSYEQIKEITDELQQPIPQRCHNAKALVRYMAHMDNPEKAQYNPSDIVAHGGVDLSDLLRPSNSERYTLIRDMMDYIRSAAVTEFQDLMDYAAAEHFDDWFPLLCDSSAYVIGQYIKSQRHRALAPREDGEDD